MQRPQLIMVILWAASWWVPPAAAAVPVGGTIASSTTWQTGTGPYLLTSTMTVPGGVSLTIEPGVVVKFSSGTSLQIDGTLLAQGTPENRIYFTSSRDDIIEDSNADGTGTSPAPGDWVKLNIGSGSTGNIIAHAVVRFGGAGTSDGDSNLYVSSSSTTISNVTFRFSANNGLRINNCAPQVSDCVMEQNAGFGAYLNSYNGVFNDNLIKNNAAGVSAFLCSAATFTNNLVENNSGYALYLDGNSTNLIAGATLSQSSLAGVYIHGGTIAQDTILPALDIAYVIHGNLYVNAPYSLTFAAGAVVKFTDLGGLIVSGGLHAQGVPGDPVYFTSLKDDSVAGDTNGDGADTTAASGNWTKIKFYAASEGNLQYAVIRYGGRGEFTTEYMVYIASSAITVNGCQIAYSQQSGLKVLNAAPAITNTSYLNNQAYGLYLKNAGGIQHGNLAQANGYGVYLLNSAAVSVAAFEISQNTLGAMTTDTPSAHLIPKFTFSQNGPQGISIKGGVVNQALTLPKLDAPYLIKGAIVAAESAPVTIAAGAILKFTATGSIDFRSTLTALGTPENKIYFTSASDDSLPITGDSDTNGDGDASKAAPGDWPGIMLTGSGSTLDNCIFSYGGAGLSDDDAMLKIAKAAVPTIKNSSFEYSQHSGLNASDSESQLQVETSTFNSNGSYGAYLNQSAGSVTNNIFTNNHSAAYIADAPALTFTNNQIKNSSGPALLLAGDALMVLPESSFEGNSPQGILIRNGRLSRDLSLPAIGIPYVIDSPLEIASTATLTAPPETIFKLSTDGTLLISGGLVAAGTELAPIIFTSIHDDSFGGDSDNNEAAVTAAPGNWRSLNFIAGSNRPSLLKHVIMRFGGRGSIASYATLTILRPELHVEQVTIEASSQSGVRLGGTAATFTECIIRTSGAASFYIDPDGFTGTINNCTIYNNGSSGALNYATNTIANMRQNYWGDPSGPQDLSDDRSSGGWYNAGTGDKVGNSIDYSDWYSFDLNQMVRTITFDPPPGIHNLQAVVTLSSATTGATIYYTTDGSDPSELDTLYAAETPIELTSSSWIKAIGYQAGLLPSEIGAAYYSINLPPVATSASFRIQEDQQGSTTMPLVEDPNPEDTYSYQIEGAFVAQHGTPTVTTDLRLAYTPHPNYNGYDSFSFKVTDSGKLSVMGMAKVQIIAVNDHPTAAKAHITTIEDTDSAGVTPAVTDPDSTDTHTYELIETETAAHGQARVQANQLFYNPNPNFAGNDSFAFRATDQAGATVLGIATVSVTPVNDPPTATSVAITTREDRKSMPFAPIVTDPDQDDTFTVSLPPVGSSAPAAIHGQAMISYNKLVYDPDTDYHGTDSFAYIVTDAAGLAITGLANVLVTPENDPPGLPVIFNPENDGETVVLRPEFIAGQAGDIDGDSLNYIFELYDDRQHTNLLGEMQQAADSEGLAQWNYPTDLSDNTRYYWRVRASDGIAFSAWIQTTFLVNTENDPPGPLVVSYPLSNSEVTSQTPTVEVTNSIDIDADQLRYSFDISQDADLTQLAAAVTNLKPEYDGHTSWKVTPRLEDNSQYYLLARVVDEHGAETESELVPFFVNSGNNPPSAPLIISPGAGEEVTTVRPDLIVGNSVDDDLDPLTYFFDLDTAPTFDNSPLSANDGFGLTEGDKETIWSTPELQDNTTYYWRVMADDGAATSSWVYDSFFVNTVNDPPEKPTLVNPGDETVLTTRTPTLEIISGGDPDHDPLTYIYQVATIPEVNTGALTGSISQTLAAETSYSTTIIIAEESAQTSWTLPTPLADERLYLWRAQARDDQGLLGPPMEYASFFVSTNNATNVLLIALVAPTSDVEIVEAESDLLISWEDIAANIDAQISLYYDTDNHGQDGTLIVANLPEDPDGAGDSYAWAIDRKIADGVYHIYAVIEAGSNRMVSYAPGRVVVNRSGTTNTSTTTTTIMIENTTTTVLPQELAASGSSGCFVAQSSTPHPLKLSLGAKLLAWIQGF